MIKTLVLLALVIGMLLFGYSLNDPGYVVFNWHNYVFETSAYGLILILVTLFGVVWFLKKSWRMLFSYGQFRQRKRSKQQDDVFAQGVEAFLLHDWQTASKQLALAGESEQFNKFASLLNLMSAVASDADGDHDTTQSFLANVDTSQPKLAALAAKIHLTQQRPEKALEMLTSVDKKHDKDPLVLRGKIDVLTANNEWQKLLALLPLAAKLRVFRLDEFRELEAKVYSGRFEEIGKSEGVDSLKSHWNKLPSKVQKNPLIASKFANILAELGEGEEAELRLLKLLKQHGISNMTEVLIDSKLQRVDKLLQQVRQSLLKDENNPELLRVLGHLAYKAHDYSLAQKALQTSSKVFVNDKDLKCLAEASLKQGETNTAIYAYRQLQQVR